MGWNIVPDGLREMLLWISLRYNNTLIFITENGSAEAELGSLESALNDRQRLAYLENHVRACAAAINDHGVSLAGYFAWSLLDNFEWQFGFQRRFGICHVDFKTLERTPRSSAIMYGNIILSNGRNLRNPDDSDVSKGAAHGDRRLLKTSFEERRIGHGRPKIPERVLVGYGSNCDAVRQAVHDGVNIVIWSFLDVVRVAPRMVDEANDVSSRRRAEAFSLEPRDFAVSTSLNLTAIRSLIREFYLEGYKDVLHFASVGGWNGAHLNTDISAVEWYTSFKEDVGDIFDGIDWDLEGNDRMASPYNFFTKNCLDLMGNISRLAKDGKFLSFSSYVVAYIAKRFLFNVRSLIHRRSICQYCACSILLGYRFFKV
jgi:Glycosyl hydrolase family 1